MDHKDVFFIIKSARFELCGLLDDWLSLVLITNTYTTHFSMIRVSSSVRFNLLPSVFHFPEHEGKNQRCMSDSEALLKYMRFQCKRRAEIENQVWVSGSAIFLTFFLNLDLLYWTLHFTLLFSDFHTSLFLDVSLMYIYTAHVTCILHTSLKYHVFFAIGF